ncbi:cbb3-type cytochrome oxidase assembly protein CcoS [Cohaesibacter gelatinilyticus]|uniref:Cytochrome oxidase maturation protein, cbb3-type n=1 Tax=Cohaesibacter gelatinilyticus TaxID=372072 RepID=A0A285NBS0_9HYPH|nr:cbb3-type cytochrome oxidase assembly protein CcoS [Cohaesibacter gelatinilyticus]SNZ05121.1 cytochrome oxidase maturation protein, cbb3-type [Cohaesibacter gelatinilyticus]HAT87254.1 cbb3-type cytochrome oxidase assembly protein CcoS [Hyphomicrobiales bacterium]
MSSLLLLIPVALGLGLLGLIAFLWSLRDNQYEDVEGAAYRILLDDDLSPEEQAKINAVESKSEPAADKTDKKDA